MFNPNAKLQVFNIDGKHRCMVVDDALLEPELWVKQAVLYQDKFSSLLGSNYPGVELKMATDISKAIMDFIRIPAKQFLNTRRLLEGYSHLSMVTKSPEQLMPSQYICHRDQLKVLPGQVNLATVLYLFKNPELGGTNFFKPKKSNFVMDMFLKAADMMSADDFEQKYDIKPEFMTQSNEYFELESTVPSKWNRLIVYDGMQFHGSDIKHPELINNNPVTGRLTLNGFFTGRNSLG